MSSPFLSCVSRLLWIWTARSLQCHLPKTLQLAALTGQPVTQVDHALIIQGIFTQVQTGQAVVRLQDGGETLAGGSCESTAVQAGGSCVAQR